MGLTFDQIGELYTQERKRIFNYALKHTRQWDVAEDICSDVFVEALEHLPVMEERGAGFRAWLMTVAWTKTKRYWYQHYRSRTFSLAVFIKEQDINEEKLAVLTSDGGIEAVEQSCDTAMAAAFLRAALEKLNPRERQVVVYCGHNIKPAQAAPLMGMGISQYYKLLNLALTKMSVALAGDPMENNRAAYAWGDAPPTCQEPDCYQPYYSNGCCRRHFDSKRKAGRRWAAKEKFAHLW